MPNVYLKKISKEHGIPIKKLEEYWERAKEIAKSRFKAKDNRFYAYVNGIFKNMASLSAESPAWWDKLSLERKKAYLQQHPNSKFRIDGVKPPKKKAQTKKKARTKKEPLNLKDLKKKTAAKNALKSKKSVAVAEMKRNYVVTKSGLNAVKDFFAKKKLTNEQKSNIKKFGKLMIKTLLATAALGSLFTPFAPYGGELFEMFLRAKNIDTSLSSVLDEDVQLGNLIEDFGNWLIDQDISIDDIKRGQNDDSK